MFRVASRFDLQSTVFITAGRKAAQFVARTGRQLAAKFEYADSPRFSDSAAIAACARDLFLRKEVDQVQVVATRFVNTLTQDPIALDYLPVGAITELKIPGMESEAESLFEPNPETVVAYLLSHYLNLYIHQALLDAKASEQSARMVSMKNATDSANHLIHDLSLEYNKQRQGNITKELLEIAGGQTE